MIKTAIFVEGQTEMIFIQDYLLKMFQYHNISINCFKLISDGNFASVLYPFSNETHEYYFEIINVGNDTSVLSKLLDREEYMWNRGFSKIFAIRDMYSDNYKEYVRDRSISIEANIRFIEGAKKTIANGAKRPDNIHFHFAIMEIEAWILGLQNCFTRIDSSLTHSFIAEHLNIDLKNDDPETTYFHPAKTLGDIYQLVNKRYAKQNSDIHAIMSHIQKEDFIELSQSGKCQSFNNIHKTLIPINA